MITTIGIVPRSNATQPLHGRVQCRTFAWRVPVTTDGLTTARGAYLILPERSHTDFSSARHAAAITGLPTHVRRKISKFAE